MDSTTFDALRQTLQQQGPGAALEQLLTGLRAEKDYQGLFYALLMQRRVELGLSPIPTESAQSIPPDKHPAYEDAIRAAGRLVGNLYLDEGNIAGAWAYFRMLGEPGPVAAALEKLEALPDTEDSQALIEIAFHNGVLPRRGFDWILERYGICSSITLVSSQDFSSSPDLRAYCVQRLVESLHDQLATRLAEDIAQYEGARPATRAIPELIAGRDALFADEMYHIDVSHLNSVVQMAPYLKDKPALKLARELCAYGAKLSPRFHYNSGTPFDDFYRDYGIYLGILSGEQVEEGLAHFREKVARADPDNDGTFPAETLVNLLLHVQRPKEALAVARQHLARSNQGQLSCPNLTELCRLTGDYQTFADVAREQGDAVHYLAGLLAHRKA